MCFFLFPLEISFGFPFGFFGISFVEVDESRVVLCTRMAREELWWENAILPPLPPDSYECEVPLMVAQTFGVAKGGAKQRRSHVGKAEGSFCLCAYFSFIIIHSIPFIKTHVFFTSRY